jgi:serine protease DegQ
MFRDRRPAAPTRRPRSSSAIGNPLGFENGATAGIISGTHRAIPGAAQQAPALVDLIQTDSPISPRRSTHIKEMTV